MKDLPSPAAVVGFDLFYGLFQLLGNIITCGFGIDAAQRSKFENVYSQQTAIATERVMRPRETIG